MNDTAKPKPKTSALAQVETSTRGLVLNNLEDMKTVSQLILQSGLAPDSFQTSEQIFVGLQAGAEIGLKPMQALNSIVVMKGKPTLWGDAALALVKRSGLSEYCKEYFELAGEKTSEKDIQYTDIKDYPDGLMAACETKRKGVDEPMIRYFSVADAKLAGLWGKRSKAGKPMPWTTHPKRMLKYKARAFNLRDNFPDVLFGMHLTEEMYGEEPLPAPESDVKPRAERRSPMPVPSSTVDTTRAHVNGSDIVAGTIRPEQVTEGPDGLVVTGVKTEPVIEGQEPSRTPVQEPQDGNTKPFLGKPVTGLVTFVCKECGLTFQYGKQEGKGVPCECGKGLLVEVENQPEPPDPSIEEKGDAASLYIEVNSMFIEQDGEGFVEFAAFVLCLDESEVAPSKLTEEQLKQIKAYIESNGVAIN